MKKIKVLWFSRHEMSAEQRAALGDVEIVQINKTIQSAQELKNRNRGLRHYRRGRTNRIAGAISTIGRRQAGNNCGQ